MANEIVGTAYVRIRAITAGLAKDIQDGIDKGSGGVDVDGSGVDLGERLSQGIKRGIGDDDGIGDGITDAIDGVDLEAVGFVAANRIQRGILDGIGDDNWGRRFGTKLGKLLKGVRVPVSGLVVGLLAAIATQLAGPFVQLIGEYIFGLVAQVGFLTTALAGLGAAGAGAFGLLLGGVLPLVLAFKGSSDYMNVLKKRAADFAKAWEPVGRATVRELVPGLVHALDILENSGLIRSFVEIGTAVGSIVGNMARMSASALTSNRNLKSMRTVVWGIKLVWERIGHLVVNLVDAAVPLMAAVAPAATQLVESLARGAEHLNTWAHEAGRVEELADKIWIWYNRTQQVMEIIKDLTSGIWNVFKIGADSAQPGMDRFAYWAETWRQWTESPVGQNRIKQIFDDAMPVFHEFNGLVKDIFKALFSPASNQDSSSLVGFLQLAREEYLPKLIELGKELAAELEEPLTELADSFAEFFEEFRKAEGLQKTIDGISAALQIFATVLRTPYLGTALAQIIGFVTAFAILNGLTFGGLGAAVSAILPVIGSLASALGSAALSTGASALASISTALAGMSAGAIAAVAAIVVAAIAIIVAAFLNADTIIEKIQQLREWFNNLAGPMKVVAAIFIGFAASVLAPIVALVAFGVAIAKWREIPKFIGGVAHAIGGFIARLPGTLVNGAQALWKWIQDAIPAAARATGRFLQRVGSAILGFIRRLPGMVASGARALWQWIQDAVPEAVRAYMTFQAKILGFLTRLPGIILRAVGRLAGSLTSWIKDADPIRELAKFLAKIVLWIIASPYVIGLKFTEWRIKFINWLIEAIADLGPKLWQFIQTIWDWIIENVPKWAERMIEFQVGILGWLVNAISQLPGYLVSFIDTIWDWVWENAPKLILEVQEFYAAIFSWLVDAIADLPGKLGEFAQGIWDWITDLPGEIVERVNSISDLLFAIGGDIIGGILEGIGEAAEEIFGLVADLAGSLVDAVKDALGINSPSTVMRAVGEDTMRGLEVGIGGRSGALRSIMKSQVGIVTDSAGQMTKGLADVKSLSDTLVRARKGFSGKIGTTDLVGPGAEQLASALNSRPRNSRLTLAFPGTALDTSTLADTRDRDLRETTARIARTDLDRLVDAISDALQRQSRELKDGAKVPSKDAIGAAIVAMSGREFTRRSGHF